MIFSGLAYSEVDVLSYVDIPITMYKRSFEVSRTLYPFDSNWVEIKDHVIHYVDEGSGPVIIMFHGNPSWSLLYSPLIQRLRHKFRCIAPDLPGFGLSSKPAYPDYGYTPKEHSDVMTDFLETLNLDSFSIFVQDWGGPIGLAASLNYADSVKNVILGNTWAWEFDPASEVGQGARSFSEKMGSDLMREKIMKKNSFVNISMGQLTQGYKSYAPDLVDEVKEAYRQPFPTPESRIPTWVFPRQIIESGPWLSELNQNLNLLLERPTLLIWGEQDPVFPTVVREAWKQRLKNYQELALPSANHFFQSDEPDQIASAILKYFK